MVMTIDDLMKELEKIPPKLFRLGKKFVDEMFEIGAISLAEIVEIDVVQAYKTKNLLLLRRPITRWIALELIDWASVGGLPPIGRREKLKEVITSVFEPWEYEYLLEDVILDIELIEDETKYEIEIREAELKELEKGGK
jgi:hypothetical protein